MTKREETAATEESGMPAFLADEAFKEKLDTRIGEVLEKVKGIHEVHKTAAEACFKEIAAVIGEVAACAIGAVLAIEENRIATFIAVTKFIPREIAAKLFNGGSGQRLTEAMDVIVFTRYRVPADSADENFASRMASAIKAREAIRPIWKRWAEAGIDRECDRVKASSELGEFLTQGEVDHAKATNKIN